MMCSKKPCAYKTIFDRYLDILEMNESKALSSDAAAPAVAQMASPNTDTIQYIVLFSQRTCKKKVDSFDKGHFIMVGANERQCANSKSKNTYRTGAIRFVIPIARAGRV